MLNWPNELGQPSDSLSRISTPVWGQSLETGHKQLTTHRQTRGHFKHNSHTRILIGNRESNIRHYDMCNFQPREPHEHTYLFCISFQSVNVQRNHNSGAVPDLPSTPRQYSRSPILQPLQSVNKHLPTSLDALYNLCNQPINQPKN